MILFLRRILILCVFVACTVSVRGQIIFINGKKKGEIHSNGDVLINDSIKGFINTSGHVYIKGERMGMIEEDGDIYMNGEKKGRFSAIDGDVYRNEKQIGQVQNDGGIFDMGIRAGQCLNTRLDWIAGIVFFFFSDQMELKQNESGK